MTKKDEATPPQPDKPVEAGQAVTNPPVPEATSPEAAPQAAHVGTVDTTGTDEAVSPNADPDAADDQGVQQTNAGVLQPPLHETNPVIREDSNSPFGG